MTATIKDVAKAAGVSISTVSRVINNSKPVSPEVRLKVLNIIKELDYRPNEIARTLVTKKSFLIGVIVTDIGNSYIAEMVRGIEEVGKMYNYDILLCSTYGDKEAEIRYMRLFKRKQVEGVILISDIDNNMIDETMEEYNIPFVYLNRYYENEKYSSVSIDYFEGSYEMTKYLIKLGHKDIAFVLSEEDEKSIEYSKLKGYKKAVSEEGYNDIVYFAKGRKIENGYDITKEILLDDSKPSAIACSSDTLAIGAINYLYDNNIVVPKDMSVVGYGDIHTARILRPKLTTVKEPFYDIGAVAIRRIIKELKGEKIEDKNINLPFSIVKRDSTS